MTKSLLKRKLLSAQPSGLMGLIPEGSDEDKIYDGIAEDLAGYKDWASQLAYVRDPYETPFLDTLEREYGRIKESNLSEVERRRLLASIVYAKRGSGSIDDLQDLLDLAGFSNLTVYANDPQVDPRAFAGVRHDTYCVDPPSFFCADPPECFCSSNVAGEYLLNGDIYDQVVTMVVHCATPSEYFCEETDGQAVCGRTAITKELITYDPTENWNLVFFIGGEATRDPVTNAIIDITPVELPYGVRKLLQRLVCQFKPQQTWAALVVNWAADWDTGYGYFPYGLSAYGL